MSGFKLGGMTFGSIFKKPITTKYPFETKPSPDGLKGHVTNRVEECILCGICSKRCPADAIVVDKEQRSWQIDGFRCIQCYSCVRECPKHCLDMLPSYTTPATSKSTCKYDVPIKEKPDKAQ